jgi:histidyl-tRNA synthetase
MERLPGFRDFYPEPSPAAEAWSTAVRGHIFAAWHRTARRYGFREYDGPPLEPLELYTTKSGAEIASQLYCFTDRGGREVAMRPEMTPTLARMVAAHERQYRKPIKWYSIPQLFRCERQQKGRLREHFQFNADVVGEPDRGADAELVALLVDSLRGLGLTPQDFVVRLSSRNAWQEFYQRQGGPADRAYEFYQTVDKLEREETDVSATRLRELGLSLEAVQAFIAAGEATPELQTIVDSLRARGLGDFVKIDYGVIRGLAYYTGPVFEAFDRKGEFRAIAGGGRYDDLIRLISGGKVNLPALGFGMGDVVLAELLKNRGLLPAAESGIDVVLLIEDESLRPASLELVQRLRDRDVSVDFALAPAKADRQFKRALELKASWTVRLEPRPEGGVNARLKRLADRSEQSLAVEDAVAAIARKPAA